MKTRRLDFGLWPLLVTAALLAAGCGATAVNGKDKAETSFTPAAPEPAVESSGASVDSATAEGAGPVQRSQRPSVPLPDDISQVVQLVESGANDEVVRAYVGGSTARYDLSLDQIIYLRDIGVSDGVIAAMMRRGSELREKDAESAASQGNPGPAPAEVQERAAANASPQPAATGVSGSPPPPPADGTPPVAVQTVQPPAEAPQSVQQFYAPLTPYGTWYQVPSYGWVWQPSVVVVDSTWMPYRHGGRWVWSDCGWYWSSDYSWGWAPFHYGRWSTYPGIGWCWVPDTVWGPSWVTWRHCDSHIGWAPLPPACGWSSGVGLTWYGSGVSVGFGFGLASSCYTFVPNHRFVHRNLSLHVEHGRDHDGAFRRSSTVNNVTAGRDNVAVNNGLGYNQIASRVHEDIPKARIQPLPATSRETLRADRMERSKDGFVVYRPTPVENAGGKPSLRSEVRPTASGSPPPSGRAGAGPVGPTRPSNVNRLADVGTVPVPKSSESRGVPAPASPAAGASRSSPVPRSSSVATPSPARNVARPYSSPAPRAAEARQLDANGPAVRSDRSAPAQGVRQTTPVPLGDPSKNMPIRLREPTYTKPTPVTRPEFSQPNPAAGGGMSAPSQGTATGRNSYSVPQSGAGVPTRPSYSPPVASPGGSGSGYGSPSGSSRPAYSQPSPSGGGASPSYGGSRSGYSAPAPSSGTPSSGTPPSSSGSSGSSRNGSRNQPN